MEEGAILRNRTLSDERGAVCPVRLLLSDAMPVLVGYQKPGSINSMKTYYTRRQRHVWVL